MKQRWWIAIVAVLGIGLAVLLFPRPDTGGQVPVGDAGGEPVVFEDGEAPEHGMSAVAPGARRVRPPEAGQKRKRPTAKPPSVLRERRSRTEVIYASKLVTPFSAIRYTLMRMGDDAAAQALAEDVGVVLNGDIRTMRLDPDSTNWDDLQVKTDAAIAQVAASSFAKDPTISKSLERYQEFVAEYHEAKASGGTPAADPDAEPPATPGGAAGGDPPKEETE
jgi:hypothetical protein